MKYGVLTISLLAAASPAFAEEKSGWSAGGDKLHGGAKAACEAFLRETESGGVRYRVERMEQTEAGDQRCWYENSAHPDGAATTYLVVYRQRRTTFEGKAIFTGSLASTRTQPTTLEHDLGPGVYYYKEQWVARSYAQAAFSQAYAERKGAEAIPDGVVYEYDFKQPGDVLDFSQGKELAEFEAAAKTELGGAYFDRMINGEVNPAQYYRAFKAYITKIKKRQPADFKILIGPDYRFTRAAEGSTSRVQPQAQIRINDKNLLKQLDRKAMPSLETRFPSKDDIAAALVGHETSALFTQCEGSTKTGDCMSWAHRAGRLLFLRRKWQSEMRYIASQGNHYHIRIGDTIIDGAHLQFDDDVANNDAKADAAGRAKLFVGNAKELEIVLDAFVKPKGGMTGKRLYDTYWNAPEKLVNGVRMKVAYQPQSAKNAGEAVWQP